MVTIKNLRTEPDGTITIEYNVVFNGVSHSLYGDFTVSNDELVKAQSNIVGTDPFYGVKQLVLEKISLHSKMLRDENK